MPTFKSLILALSAFVVSASPALADGGKWVECRSPKDAKSGYVISTFVYDEATPANFSADISGWLPGDGFSYKVGKDGNSNMEVGFYYASAALTEQGMLNFSLGHHNSGLTFYSDATVFGTVQNGWKGKLAQISYCAGENCQVKSTVYEMTCTTN